MDDPKRNFETSGWHDVPGRKTLTRGKGRLKASASTPSNRRWHHVRWITLIIVLIALAGYVLSSYLDARAGQSASTWDQLFAAPHAVAALKRHENAKPRALAKPLRSAQASGDAGTVTNGRRPGQATESATPRTTTYRRAAAEALGLKCISGIAYRTETQAGVTSYTNDSDIRCADG